MGPEQLKLAAVTLAVVSVICLASALRSWLRSPAGGMREPAEHRAWHGGGVLTLVALFLLGAVVALARPMGWPRDSALWVAFGAFLAVMTVTRPWWFWDNYRARWLRDLIGSEATALFYLLLAGVMMWVGLFTDWTFGRR